MDCIQFWVWFGTGVFIVPGLELLKKLPGALGAFSQKWAGFIAPLLSIAAPILAMLISPLCATVDPLGWALAYAALAFLVSQLIYRIGKVAGKVV